MNPKNLKSRYEVTTYDAQEISTKPMTREQAMAIKPQSFDYFLSSAFGIWGFRTAEDEWIEHRGGNWPGLGDVCIRIIQDIQFNSPDFLTPPEVADHTGRFKLRNGYALSARLMTIREIHKESFKKPHFFLSRRAGGFAIAWNPEKTWCWVERITPAMGVSE